MSHDADLGKLIRVKLEALGIETPMLNRQGTFNNECCSGGSRWNKVFNATEDVLEALGLDLNDDSLNGTSKRIAKMYCQEIFTGLDYDNFPKCTTVENKMRYDEMVCVTNIDIKSMCEHHFMPFIGTAAIAYIPRDKVLGLSKFNRVANFFARRPQIQERLTEQITAALQFILGTEDVAVVIRAEHYCVKMRGVEDNSITVTSKLDGKFRLKPELRAEFLSLAHA